MISHWIALRFICARLALIFEIQELKLQCRFNLFGRCLCGDVRCGGNLENVGDNIYAKCDARFSHWIALRFVCARLSSIFDIPEVELQFRISVFWLLLSGDVHILRNRHNVRNCLRKMQRKVSHTIALRLCCTRLAPIFDIPEVELQCNCSPFRSVLSGYVDLRW